MWHKIVMVVAVLGFFSMAGFAQDKKVLEAVNKDDVEKVRKLIEATPSLIKVKDGLGRPLLHLTGKKEIAEFLISMGADPNEVDAQGNTALFLG